MAMLGAHESIAGGYYKAVELAHAVGGDCVQLFTKNNNQWRANPISAEEAGRFAPHWPNWASPARWPTIPT